ncbi:hypothetical protein TIFTF001_007056 [Ficus carica]|uniref:Ribosome biogenesis protein slx9-like n=1 Tax=Ficus carica TaxID=3494 RepID=A0AA88ACK0_FICCA|nr:hypothetical protein TIFTF001_007056 [Ficus carica]
MGKPSSRSESTSKADRKFEKKLEFYSKVRDTVAALTAQKTIAKKKKLRSRQKKFKAYDLSSLSEFLPKAKAPEQPAPANLKLDCKSRRKLILKEVNQLNAVLKHPVFQSDPLAAIHQHLQSTQPVTEEKPKKKNKSGGKKKKNKKSKASAVPESMDM